MFVVNSKPPMATKAVVKTHTTRARRKRIGT